MACQIVDGKHIASVLRAETADIVRHMRDQGHDVRLDAVMVGNPSAGEIYARSQQCRCEEVGINYRLHTLEEHVDEAALRTTIESLNHDDDVTGILLNLPLPDRLDTPAIQYCIDPYKDVEGVNPANIGLLFYDNPIIAPCTALAVMKILESARVDPRGMDAVVVGLGAIAGRPIALFLQHKMATVSMCHVETRDLIAYTRQADLLIVATGRAHLIGAEHVKPGAVVIDVGINRVDDPANPGRTKIIGDVRFEEVRRIASVLTPVPGGVGPVTVAMLLRSAAGAARSQLGPRRISP